MKKKNKTISCASTLLLTVASPLFAESDANQHSPSKLKFNRPNVLFILADDLGQGDLSCMNPKSKIQTPHIDKIAEEGRIFTHCHSSSAVCTPSRYGILTGNYDFRSGLKAGVLDGYDKPLIKEEEATIGDLYANSGYETAYIGKWHLGLNFQKLDNTKPLIRGGWEITDSSNVNFFAPITGGPEDCGFSHTFYFPASLDIAPYIYIHNYHVTATEIAVNPYFSGTEGNFMRKGAIGNDVVPEEVLPRMVDETISFIQTSNTKNNPFFVHLSLPSPHTPYFPDKAHEGKSKAGVYGDYVQMTDTVVGKLMNYLNDAGLSENTWVIVTSDNGAWLNKVGMTDFLKTKYQHNTNGELFGGKSDLYEGGHRVPLVMRYPGHIPAGSISKETFSLVDFMAISANILDVKLTDDQGLDSVDVSEAIFGNEEKYNIRDSVLVHSIDGSFALISDGWKYLYAKGSGGWTKRMTAKEQLYHLENDPMEKKNLRNRNKKVVVTMKKKLNDILKSEKTR